MTAPLEVGLPVVVRLVKLAKADIAYSATVVSDDGNHLVVEAAWAEPEMRDIGVVAFQPGDVFTEHYWRDRWYSVKEVRAPDGSLKGWYTDAARPVRVEASTIVSEDLILDLWVSADRRTIARLDEDEFHASGIEGSDPVAAREAAEAIGYLTARVDDDWDAVFAD